MHYMDRIPRQIRAGMHITGILLDVNNFKLINDMYGHVQGDGVLRAVGQILLRATRDSRAAVVRYGGDEFLILLPSSQPEEIRCIKDRIGRELHQYNSSGKTPLPVSLSAGISELGESGLFQFFQDMDRAMYQEKKAFYLNVTGATNSGSDAR